MVETMAYAGELPWHGLGTKVADGIGVDDMIREAGLDWQVEKIPALAAVSYTHLTLPTTPYV